MFSILIDDKFGSLRSLKFTVARVSLHSISIVSKGPTCSQLFLDGLLEFAFACPEDRIDQTLVLFQAKDEQLGLHHLDHSLELKRYF